MKINKQNLRHKSSACELRSQAGMLNSVNGFCFSIAFLVICMAGLGFAETKIQEPDLFNLLENDLHTEGDLQEPNSLIDRSSITENITVNTEEALRINENDLIITQSPTTPIGHKLWRARIATTGEAEGSRSKNELKQLIQQIRSIEIQPKTSIAAAETVVEPSPEIEDADKSSEAQVTEKVEIKEVDTKTADGPISEQTLELFKDAAQQPEKIQNPQELGEILFKSGALKEAAACYQEALNRMPTDERIVCLDKAWILLQLGNCLRYEEPKAALENYETVMSEFPDSPWTQVAKAKIELVNWYMQDEPMTLIDSTKPMMDSK